MQSDIIPVQLRLTAQQQANVDFWAATRQVGALQEDHSPKDSAHGWSKDNFTGTESEHCQIGRERETHQQEVEAAQQKQVG